MKLLVIEDNKVLGKNLKIGFEDLGWTVDLAIDGDEGSYCLSNGEYDVAIIDRMLPKVMGCQLISKLRANNNSLPVIMITARDSIDDRVSGFEVGADDYVSKPFDFRELVARIKALYRRTHAGGQSILIYRNLRIDLNSRKAFVDNRDLDLTAKEYDLLNAFATQPGKVRTREELNTLLYELNEEPESNSIDVILARLRRKLAGSEVKILTVRSKGFVFSTEALHT